MTQADLKKMIENSIDLFEFEYDCREGNIDPYYIPETKSMEYLLYFDGNEKIVKSIEEVMNTPFIDGKSLNDLAAHIQFTDGSIS